jgi:glycosyltransferase involved in cell wall biosynthesis
VIKILFVIGQLDTGGAEQQLLYLAENLDKTKYQVKICCFSENLELLSQKQINDLDIVVIPQVMRPDFTRPFKLHLLVREYQPDLIHSFLFVANTWARIVGKCNKIPTILSERNANPRKHWKQIIINRLLFSFGSILIANSRAGAKQIIKNKEFPAKNIHIIHNGIPFKNFCINLSLDQKILLQKELGIQPDQKVIGVIGRLDTQKNHELLFDSLIKVQKYYPNAIILCIGDGPRKKFLEEYIIESGLKNDVIFTGVRKDIPACLHVMDILALPSRWEGCPNVILEAMAAKVPVVATDVGGVSEIITNGKTGFLVDSKNYASFANKIIFLLKNPKVAATIAENGLVRIKNNFSIDEMVQKTIEVYKEF